MPHTGIFRGINWQNFYGDLIDGTNLFSFFPSDRQLQRTRVAPHRQYSDTEADTYKDG